MSLIKLLHYSPQGEIYFQKYSDYEIFSNACWNNDFNNIKKYANKDFLTRCNFYAFKNLVAKADLDSLKYIIRIFGPNLNLYLGLVETCMCGNYQNFLYLLKLTKLSTTQLNELLEITVQGYEKVSYKQTQVFEIYYYLLKIVKTPNYNKLLESNASERMSSFEIFKDLFLKSTNINLIQIFKMSCMCDNISKANYIYLSNKDLITECVNSDQNFFIELCKKECIWCVELICKINEMKNYSTTVSEFVDEYGSYPKLNYRIKDNSGNIILQHVNQIQDFDQETI